MCVCHVQVSVTFEDQRLKVVIKEEGKEDYVLDVELNGKVITCLFACVCVLYVCVCVCVGVGVGVGVGVCVCVCRVCVGGDVCV